MKKSNVKLGQTYAAKVSGAVVPVRLDKENPHGGWDGTNMKTKKPVRIKSAQRLRGLWPSKTMPVAAAKAEGRQKPATGAKQATGTGAATKGKKAAQPKKERPSLLNLAAKVLAEAKVPMTCKEMVDKVLATGLWTTKGKTPAATLYSAILREIQTKRDAARFFKVERGKFAAAK